MELHYNTNLATKVIVKKIQEGVGSIYSYYYKNEDNADVVKASFSLAEDMAKLREHATKVPIIFIARANNIRTENRGQLNFYKKDELTLVSSENEEESIHLSGQWFEFETDLQVVIMAKSTFNIIELQTELKRILNTSLKEQFYPLVVGTKDGKLYRCNDYATVSLYGFEEAAFERQEVKGIKAVSIQGIAREQYFKLEDAPELVNMEILYDDTLLPDGTKYP